MKKALILLVHAFTGWGLCGAAIGIGRSVTSMETTLIVHAIAAPVIFSLLSIIYFRKFKYTSPLQTALIFASFVMFMDAVLVAPVFEHSYEMFWSPLGTWIPFLLIFTSTYLTGLFLSSGSIRY